MRIKDPFRFYFVLFFLTLQPLFMVAMATTLTVELMRQVRSYGRICCEIKVL